MKSALIGVAYGCALCLLAYLIGITFTAITH